MADPAPERALAAIARELSERGRRFALVGGLAVSVRAEVRFTRDVDVVVLVCDDADAEQLITTFANADTGQLLRSSMRRSTACLQSGFSEAIG